MHGWLHVIMLLRPPGRALSAHARPDLAAADRGRQHGVSLSDDRTDCNLPMRERETHTHTHTPATALSNLHLFSQPYDSIHIFRRIALFQRLPPPARISFFFFGFKCSCVDGFSAATDAACRAGVRDSGDRSSPPCFLRGNVEREAGFSTTGLSYLAHGPRPRLPSAAGLHRAAAAGRRGRWLRSYRGKDGVRSRLHGPPGRGDQPHCPDTEYSDEIRRVGGPNPGRRG